MNCPKTGFNLLPAGGRYSIDDIIISSDAVTDVTIRFNPPRLVVLTAFMDANDTVVTNFQEEVETNDEQAIKIDCGGVATVSVTLVGNGEL